MGLEADFLGFVVGYSVNLPSEVLAGNVFAVSILLILFYLVVVVINRLTNIIILLLKKFILLFIVSLAFYQFLQFFIERLGSEGLTVDTLILGLVGSVVGFIALMIAIHGAFHSLVLARPGKGISVTKERLPEEESGKPGVGGIISAKSLRGDKKLGVVIAYLVVAEFGVISSKTISAPDVAVGMGFFIAFMLAAIFFVYQSYNDFRTGLRHFIAVFVLGGALSLMLGYFWGGYSLDELLSEAYFISDSMVAFVTGIAVSLFMGSKG